MTKQILEKITEAGLASGGKRFVVPVASIIATIAIFSEVTILIEDAWRTYFHWPLYFVFVYNLGVWVNLKRHAKAAAKKLRSSLEE